MQFIYTATAYKSVMREIFSLIDNKLRNACISSLHLINIDLLSTTHTQNSGRYCKDYKVLLHKML